MLRIKSSARDSRCTDLHALFMNNFEHRVLRTEFTASSMFARLGRDYEIRNQWFFAILEAMTTN